MARSVRLRHIDVSLPSIPIGATDSTALERLGRISAIRPWTLDLAFRLHPKDREDMVGVWIAAHRTDHREVWDCAWPAGSQWRLDAFHEGHDTTFDVDHVFPRSWALNGQRPVQFVRLFPVESGVNRSAGAGREKAMLRRGETRCRFDRGVYFADELQLHKILGLDPNEAGD